MLYRRHAERVWRYCLTCLRRDADAEDALQQTFLQAHRALDRGVAPDSEVAWLLTIARNVCLTRLDSRRRRGSIEISSDPNVLADVVAAGDVEDAGSDDVQAALARLPLRQREALFLREWQGCSYAEIAAALDTSEAAVETLLFRARRSLERELGPRRSRARDLAGLLGWLRVGFGSAASKVVVGAALATTAGVGTAVVLQAGHAPRARRHPAVSAVPASPGRRVTTERVAQARQVPAARAPRRRHTAPVVASVPRNAPSAVHPVAAPPSRAGTAEPGRPQPAQTAPSAAAQAQPATASPAPPAPTSGTTTSVTTTSAAATTTVAVTTTASSAVSATASAASDVVGAAADATSSTVDAVAQTATTVAPATAPVVDPTAQTVDGVVQTTASAVQSATSTTAATVNNLLSGGH